MWVLAMGRGRGAGVPRLSIWEDFALPTNFPSALVEGLEFYDENIFDFKVYSKKESQCKNCPKNLLNSFSLLNVRVESRYQH